MFSVSKDFWLLQAHVGRFGCTETFLASAASRSQHLSFLFLPTKLPTWIYSLSILWFCSPYCFQPFFLWACILCHSSWTCFDHELWVWKLGLFFGRVVLFWGLQSPFSIPSADRVLVFLSNICHTFYTIVFQSMLIEYTCISKLELWRHMLGRSLAFFFFFFLAK